MMKIKNFMCYKITSKNLEIIEKEINDFTSTHNVLDIKINIATNEYGAIIIYTVLYKEDDNG